MTRREKLPKMRIEYHDNGPDEAGRRRFALYWIGYNPNTNKVGPRAQEFHADPAPYLARHPELRKETP